MTEPVTRPDCEQECWAEDRVDCFDMEDDRRTGRDPWDRPRAMAGLAAAIVVAVGTCACACHNEFAEVDL